MSTASGDDLGFTWRVHKTGEILVHHHGRLAATLRGDEARDFLVETQSADPVSQQQLMARLTGNYKHGNERTASRHPRNRQ
jgi:hypothetical protein